jgi:hypothetical protein
MSWRNEFGTDWAVPQVIDAHPELTDTSWHNDVSPSFQPRAMADYEQDEVQFRLWVQHPDPLQREYSTDGGRYLVFSQTDDGGDEGLAYEGDDAEAAIAAVLQLYATWRAAHPVEQTQAREAARMAAQAAQEAAQDAQQRQHAAQHPDGCGACTVCLARVSYGLTVDTLIVLTDAHPWSGQGQRGTEKVTKRVRIANVRQTGFDYVTVQVLDVANPLPGGPYDGDDWRTREWSGYKGGMSWAYALAQVDSGAIKIGA